MATDAESPQISSIAVAERPNLARPPAPRVAMRLTAMDVATAAKALSSALGRLVTEEQVRQVAEAGDLARADGTFSLIDYVAFLTGEVTSGRD